VYINTNIHNDNVIIMIFLHMRVVYKGNSSRRGTRDTAMYNACARPGHPRAHVQLQSLCRGVHLDSGLDILLYGRRTDG